MSRFYENQFKKLALLMVMLLVGISTALAQTFVSNSPVCAGSQLQLTYTVGGGCTGTTSVQFTGPGYSVAGTQISPGVWRATRNSVLVSHSGTYFATPNVTSTCPTLNTSVTVNPLPLTPVISGAKDLCGLNNVVDYTILPYDLTGRTVLWSVTQGSGVIVAGQGTGTVTINWGLTPLSGALNVTITNSSTGCAVTTTNYLVNIWAYPTVYDLVILPDDNGGYCYDDNGIEIGLDGSETGVQYLLKKDGVTQQVVDGTGSPIWFTGYFTGDGSSEYSIEAATLYCNQPMIGSVYPEEYATPVADAGDGGEVCSDNLALDTFTFDAEAPYTINSGTDSPSGEWTYTGPGNASFTPDAGTATATVTVDAYGVYTFTWTVTNGPCEDSDQVVVTFFEKPAIGFSFDGVLAETGSPFEYCYDYDFSVTLSHVWAGQAPFTFEWQADNGIAPVTGTFTGGLGATIFGPNTFNVGTYTITLNSLIDANGCSPTSLAPWLAYLTIHPEPTLDIAVVNSQTPGPGNILSPPYEFCFDGEFGIAIAGDVGTAPWSLNYKIVGPGSFEETGTLTGTSGVVWIELDDNYVPGTYTFSIESLYDAKCVADDLSGYTFNVEVLPEPELKVKVDGDDAPGETFNFCFDDVIDIYMAGKEGTAPWTVGWSVTGPMNFSDVMSGVSGTWTYDLTDFLPGTYTLTITSLVDDKGCVATQATLDSYEFYIIIHQEPKVTAITLVYSLNDDLSAYSAVSGNLNDGYEICINDNDDYYYLGVSSLTADDVLYKDYANEFFFGTTPPGFFAYWAARGVDGSNNAGGWELAMWDIINGDEPVFTLEYDGTDYSLYDGLQGKPDFLRINGDYLPGEYTFTGTVKSADGCFSDVTVAIEFLDDPNADAGDDPLCVTESFYELEAEYSVVGSTGEWTYVGPGTLSFIPDVNTATATITADVAGVYTLTWTETNGICVDSDDVVVTFLKGTIADATEIDPISDIYTIAGTAAVIYSKTVYGNTSTSDANINVDALIKFKYDDAGSFPTGAKIIKVNYKVNPMPNFITLPVVNGNIGDKEEFLLSWVLGQVDALTLYSNKTIEWEIFVDGVSAPMTIPMIINAVTYIGTYTNTCYAVLDDEDFDITGATATNTLSGTYTACYPDDDLVVNAEIVYPQINVDNRVKADALLKTDKAFNVGATIAVKYNGGPAGTYTVTGSPLSEIYLSDLLGSTPTPLAGHSGLTVNWEFTISDLNPGTYNITVESLARLDNQVGPPTTYSDYLYDTDNAKLIVVGALGVTVDAGDDISTVSSAPVIFEVEVAYGNLAAQNIDPSVMVDALIEFDTQLPAGAYVVELLHDGQDVPLFNDQIGQVSSVLLSSLIGTSAPTALAPHTGLTNVWTITIAGVASGTYTATVQSIAYVDYLTCYSVMAEDDIAITWADLVTSSTTPNPICEGEVAEFTVTITYPTITSNNPSDIKTDAILQLDQIIDEDVEIEWSYNGGPYSTYTFLADLPAYTEFKLSDIVNQSNPGFAPTPLAGHDGLTVTWSLKISGLDRADGLIPVYNLFIVPIATLDGEDYDLEQETPLTEIPITVFKAIDPTITGPVQVFSGAVEEYSVAVPMDYLPTYPTYSWSADPAPAVSISDPSARVVSLTFIWNNPLLYNEVDLTVVINDGVCVASETITIEILPNTVVGQLKYYNSQNSPMPSPYNAWTPVGEITDYFYVSLVSSDFDVEMESPYFEGFGKEPSQGGVIDTQKIETVYFDDEPTKDAFFLEAAFNFDYNLNPNAEYRIVVWDGGFFEEDPSFTSSPQLLYSWTWNNWNSEGKINAGDALMIMHMAVNNQVNLFPNMCHIGAQSETPKYGFYAFDVTDVNSSGSLSSLDALLTMRRSLGLIPQWPTTPQYRKPNFAVMGIMDDLDANELMDGDFSAFDVNYWCNTLPEIEFSKRGEQYKASTLAEDHNYYTDRMEFGTGWKYFNIFYNNVGDVRGRTVPELEMWKAAPSMELNYTDAIAVNKGAEVTIPVSLDQYADLGALSLGLTYRKDLIEVIATSYGEDNAFIDHENGIVRVGWATLEGQQFEADAPVVLLTVRVLADIDASVRLFELTNYTELVDRNVNTIEGVNFKSFSLTTDLTQATGAFASANYPNPFNAQTTISYTLPEAGSVKLIIYNKMGQVVKTMVNDYQSAGLHEVKVNSTDLNGPGVYYYKLEVKGESNDYSSSNSMILIR